MACLPPARSHAHLLPERQKRFLSVALKWRNGRPKYTPLPKCSCHSRRVKHTKAQRSLSPEKSLLYLNQIIIKPWQPGTHLSQDRVKEKSFWAIHSAKRNSEWMPTRQWFSLWQLTRLRFDQKHSDRKKPHGIQRGLLDSIHQAWKSITDTDASLVSRVTCLSALWSLSEYKCTFIFSSHRCMNGRLFSFFMSFRLWEN